MHEPRPRTAVLQALAVRLFLAALGLGTALRSRMEVASPTAGLDAYAESAFLRTSSSGNASPASSQATPLLVPLVQATGSSLLAAALLPSLCDAMSAGLLRRLALLSGSTPAQAAGAAEAFLWSPFALLTCASGSLAPLYTAAVLAAAVWAAEGRPMAAGAALAWASHMAGGHTAFFLPPLALLLCNRAQSSLQKRRCGRLFVSFAAASLLLASLAGAALCGSTRCACCGWPTWLVSATPPLAALCSRSAASAGNSLHPDMRQLAWLAENSWRGGDEQQPGSHLMAPNLGLQWYLFAQVFPKFRHFFGYCFVALPAAVALPLALRFPRRPLLALAAQALVLCMLGPHPTYADIALWLALVPLLREELPLVAARLWLALSLPAVLGMNTAAYELWLTLGTGNANFFYGMNLLWAGWQVAALSELLRAGCRAEVAAAGGTASAKVGKDRAVAASAGTED